MQKMILALGAISAFLVSQATAQTVVTDLDGNGVYSMEELVAAHPDLTEAQLSAADSNSDGSVDAAELAAAIAAGHIPG